MELLIKQIFDWATQNGAAGVAVIACFLLLLGLKSGFLRTKWEIDAEVDRRERAERQVDTILPALDRLTDIVQRLRL